VVALTSVAIPACPGRAPVAVFGLVTLASVGPGTASNDFFTVIGHKGSHVLNIEDRRLGCSGESRRSERDNESSGSGEDACHGFFHSVKQRDN
jgi:hypothetical protein